MADSLDLNIAGAQGNVSGLHTVGGHIESTAGQLKATSANLFQGVLVGTGADAGSDFSAQIDSAVNSSRDVIQRLKEVVHGAVERTVGYDQTSFPGVFG